MSKEVMQQALEALNSFPTRHLTPFISSARTAVREALAEQPAQQEPVKWSDYEPDGMHHNKPARTLEELYALSREVLAEQPAQRKPLTEEEIEAVWKRVQANDFHDCVQPFARAIEAAHGIKENT